MLETRGLCDERVASIYEAVIATSSDDPNQIVHIDGIRGPVEFNRYRLKTYQNIIAAFLDSLPEDFREQSNGGCGGMTLLGGNHDRNCGYRQWADQHQSIEHLFELGLAIGKVAYLDPRLYRKEYPRFVIFGQAKGIPSRVQVGVEFEEIKLKAA